MIFFYTSDVWSPEDRERDLIRKNIQTDKVLDLIANTTPTVAQQAQTPTVAQQADMHNLRTTVERKPTQRFTPSTYNQQKTKIKKNKSGSCLLYTSPSPRDATLSRMPSSA